jgi:hypothetical protein
MSRAEAQRRREDLVVVFKTLGGLASLRGNGSLSLKKRFYNSAPLRLCARMVFYDGE